MPKLDDMTGRTFDRLEVIERVEDLVYPSGQHATQYRVRCRCGTEKVVCAARLSNGQTTSCGCRKSEVTAARNRDAKREVLSYSSRHSRRQQSDPASNHLCIDCTLQAQEWSYVGGCPDELSDDGRLYCMHDEHYVPRCKSCHSRVDGVVRNLSKALR